MTAGDEHLPAGPDLRGLPLAKLFQDVRIGAEDTQSLTHWRPEMVRTLFWLALLAAATAWLLWYMTAMPGVSYSGPLKPLTGDETRLAKNLRRHVIAIASREHNQFRFAELEASARYIERTFEGYGYRVQAHRAPAGEVRNIEVEVGRGACLRDHCRRCAL